MKQFEDLRSVFIHPPTSVVAGHKEKKLWYEVWTTFYLSLDAFIVMPLPSQQQEHYSSLR